MLYSIALRKCKCNVARGGLLVGMDAFCSNHGVVRLKGLGGKEHCRAKLDDVLGKMQKYVEFWFVKPFHVLSRHSKQILFNLAREEGLCFDMTIYISFLAKWVCCATKTKTTHAPSAHEHSESQAAIQEGQAKIDNSTSHKTCGSPGPSAQRVQSVQLLGSLVTQETRHILPLSCQEEAKDQSLLHQQQIALQQVASSLRNCPSAVLKFCSSRSISSDQAV